MAAAVTLRELQEIARRGERRLAGLTVYDASFARVLDAGGLDFLLVGDSLGMTVQGHGSTRPVTMDDMVYHTRCAARGVERSFLISDMPFMSFREVPMALDHAAQLVQEGGARMVKLEASLDQAEIVRALSEHGVPVCAHLGLRPQSLERLERARMYGHDPCEADELQATARELEQAGANLLLLECVAGALAQSITDKADIPVIGIGSGAHCDGQVLVLYDLLGLTDPMPRHARCFLGDGEGQGSCVETAVRAYVQAVRSGRFP